MGCRAHSINSKAFLGIFTNKIFVRLIKTNHYQSFQYANLLKVLLKIFRNANFYLSNRLSYALGLCGPSFTVDTACSSSAYALDCAYKYIMSGACDAAIVGGSQLVLNLKTTIEYSR